MKDHLKEAEGIARKLKAMLRERHDLLKGIHDNPFLKKPVLLEQPCPKCHTSGESINNDLTMILPELIAQALEAAYQRGQKDMAEKEGERLRGLQKVADILDCDPAQDADCLNGKMIEGTEREKDFAKIIMDIYSVVHPLTSKCCRLSQSEKGEV